jgi:valyl-tRNA synthetase
MDLPKAFDPRDFEKRLYRFWLGQKVFAPKGDGQPFVIVIPPPNVTGVLHMGHGLNNSLQDILVRYFRMDGRPTLWLPGTDHAGIATQNVVEQKLQAEGLSRVALGRERFVEETWKVKRQHHRVIKEQLQRLGASCDWDRERFTLDEGLSRAVREVFVTLYERGLIYRGKYLVNWCTSCGTAISDDEVEHEELEAKLYTFRYPLADGSGEVRIATTRPETMLGDTAVAVHPEDPRYRKLVGTMVRLPLAERSIPVIADASVSREFGTGAVKVTPAHDPNDHATAERHGLAKISILTPEGRLNENTPERYRGLTVQQGRARVLQDMTDGGYFIADEPYRHQVGHCYRCHTIIEPTLSLQWFVRMKPMANKALAVWREGRVVFHPKRWENTYRHWLMNIRDWCISRQLWWGHRIPVWYCDECSEMIVSRNDPAECPACGSDDLSQDPDVLDTWFSSWLWPFSTLGWPEETEDLRSYYPTSTLVTAYDIIFFWVSRMIMAGMEFMEEVPFRDIYIHGIIRDKRGRKMSKSLGNGVDPLEIIDEFGADALKFTLAFLAAQGQDILMDKETFRMGSKFANKLWNAARFILLNSDGRAYLDPKQPALTDLDRWIYHRLNLAIERTRNALEVYHFNEAAAACYEFFWSDFCDWYIEAAKLPLKRGSDEEKDHTASVLVDVLTEALRLLHPFLSFITEEIYQKLPNTEGSIVTAAYPTVKQERFDSHMESQFALVQELVRGVRSLRSEFTLPPEKSIPVTVRAEDGSLALFEKHRELIALLAGAEPLELTAERPPSAGAPAAGAPAAGVPAPGGIPTVGSHFEAFLYLQQEVDLPKEIARFEKEKAKLQREIQRVSEKLSKPSFRQKAPAAVVEGEQEKLSAWEKRMDKLEGFLSELQPKGS